MDERFPTTRWEQIDAAARDRTAAGGPFLEICRSYWYPIYAFIRSRGFSTEEAADLTQSYFARLMEGRLLERADRVRGRFRALLRTDCAYFLADARDRARAVKRGGGRTPLSLDATAAEERYHHELAAHYAPEQVFDRAWALDLLARAMRRLEQEEREAGRGQAFAILSDVLAGPSTHRPYRDLAAALDTTEAAVEAAVRRLRGRYRRALRAAIAETRLNPTEADIDEEIGELFEALRQ